MESLFDSDNKKKLIILVVIMCICLSSSATAFVFWSSSSSRKESTETPVVASPLPTTTTTTTNNTATAKNQTVNDEKKKYKGPEVLDKSPIDDPDDPARKYEQRPDTLRAKFTMYDCPGDQACGNPCSARLEYAYKNTRYIKTLSGIEKDPCVDREMFVGVKTIEFPVSCAGRDMTGLGFMPTKTLVEPIALFHPKGLIPAFTACNDDDEDDEDTDEDMDEEDKDQDHGCSKSKSGSHYRCPNTSSFQKWRATCSGNTSGIVDGDDVMTPCPNRSPSALTAAELSSLKKAVMTLKVEDAVVITHQRHPEYTIVKVKGQNSSVTMDYTPSRIRLYYDPSKKNAVVKVTNG